MSAFDLATQLDGLREQSLLRVRRIVDSACGPQIEVDGRALVAFCSNDYLGLAADPALIAAVRDGAQRYGVGSGASHLISGHYSPHDALEGRLAAFVGMPRTLYFSTGYMANLGVLTTLLGRDDAVFSDELNHASIIDGIRLCGAERNVFPHCDMAALDVMLAACKRRRKMVVTESVFSMDGDLAPLRELLALCDCHDALLMVDDAHGFGVLGEQGRGCLSHFGITSSRIVYVGTLGKAAGVSGAFAAASAQIVEWLVQRARSYIFTTGAPPMLAQTLLTSIDLVEQGDERRRRLRQAIDLFRAGLCTGRGLHRWHLLDSTTAVQPLILGGNHEALQVAVALMEQGLWVPAIRPPTVPEGTARLRITLSAAHTPQQVQRLVEALLALQ